jgi:hypothetical protein
MLSLMMVSLCLVGCGKAYQEKALRERAQKFIGHLCRGETDACLEYADPIFVRAHGTNGTKLALGVLGLAVKVFSQTEQTMRIDEVVLSEDGKKATVRVSLQVKGEWKPIAPSKWIYADGKWYITF